MKRIIALSILALSINTVSAENLFQNNNPFPQTVPQSMNNIYQSEPEVIKQEEKKQVKFFWRRNKKQAETPAAMDNQPKVPVYPVENGQVNDGSFYMFTTGQ